jgi:hypothetical protein
MNKKQKPLFVTGNRSAMSLIEVIVAMAMASIVMLTVALLVQSGYKSWHQTYNNANRESLLDPLDTVTAFGSIGRKSNKTDYSLYTVNGGTFTKPVPQVNPEEILTGQAVEFRYWSTDLQAGMLSPTSTPDRYALFYLNGTDLKVDWGTNPPGGVNGTHQRTTSGITNTVTLAKNVTNIEFSHTSRDIAGDGKGCVRMKLEITDPTTHVTKTTLAATYIRNAWP